MHSPKRSSQSALSKTFATLVCIIMMIATAAIFTPLPKANAALANVTVKDVTASKEQYSSADTPVVRNGDTVKVSVTFDVPLGGIQNAGDTFTITLGEDYSVKDAAGTITDKTDPSKVVANCSGIGQHEITCTFTEYARVLNATNALPNSTLIAYFKVDQNAENHTQYVIKVSGQATTTKEIPIPEENRPSPGTGTSHYHNSDFRKESYPVEKDDTDISWHVYFNANEVLQNLTPAQLADGTSRTITIEDTLGPDQIFDTTANKWVLRMHDNEVGDDPKELIWKVSDSCPSTGNGEADWCMTIDYNDAKNVASVHITGPWQVKTNYALDYHALFTTPDGKPKPGATYENTAQVPNGDDESTAKYTIAEDATGTVSPTAVIGSFNIAKVLKTTDISSEISADSTYPVTAKFTLPYAANAYANWSLPAGCQAAANSTTGTCTIEVKNGQTSGNYQFPDGTKIVISEDVAALNNHLGLSDAQYKWKDATFTVNGANGNEFTITGVQSCAIDNSHDPAQAARCDNNVAVVATNEVVVPPTTSVLTEPKIIDDCGPNNRRWDTSSYQDTPTYTWSLENDGKDLVATTTNGYVFSRGETRKVFPLGDDTNEPCTVDIAIPAQPEVEDPCGPDNIRWKSVPKSTDQIEWGLDADQKLTATAKAGYKFTDGSATKTFTLPADSGELCEIDVPAQPKSTDECGPNNAQWIKPEDTAEVTWTLNSDKHLIAKTTANYKFADGTTSHDFGVAPDSNEPCIVEIPVPAQPESEDPCGTDNVRWKSIPQSDEKVEWALGSGQKLTATVRDGYKFADGSTVKTFTLPADSNEPCEVPPTPDEPPTPTTPDEEPPTPQTPDTPTPNEEEPQNPPTPESEKPSTPVPSSPQKDEPKPVLAKTGSEVTLIAGICLAAMVTGFTLIIRKRNA